MADRENQESANQMTVGKGIGIYLVCLIGLMILVKLGVDILIPKVILFCFYLVFGFILNRFVLRGLVDWHPVYNTLDNVYKDKLRMLFLWPITYLVMFFKLGVTKYL